jgi:hypothetical protein
MNNRITTRAAAVATTLGAAGPSWAAPVLTMTTAVKAAVPSAASDVRYYRGRYYRGGYYRNNGGAVALGILGAVGGVAAASTYNRGPYYQPQGYYYGGYGGGPSYYGGGPQYGYGPGAGYYGYPQYYGHHQSY